MILNRLLAVYVASIKLFTLIKPHAQARPTMLLSICLVARNQLHW